MPDDPHRHQDDARKMSDDATLSVGDVARVSGVSIRSLHHYDDVGLLRPTDRSDAGYRLYSRRDLDRLQEILVHRALGLSLTQISQILDQPEHDRIATLRATREELRVEAERISRVTTAIDAAIAAEEHGRVVTLEEMFGGFDPTTLDRAIGDVE